MSLNKFAAFWLILLALSYASLALMLPNASIGRAYEPKIFPLILAILLGILSLILFFMKSKERLKISFGKAGLKISLTLLNCVFYALIFAEAGYILATFIFMSLEFFIFRGYKSYKSSLLIAAIFATFAYLLFNKVLGISLPAGVLAWIA